MFKFNLNFSFRLVPKMQGVYNIKINFMLEKLAHVTKNDYIIALLRSNDEANAIIFYRMHVMRRIFPSE